DKPEVVERGRANRAQDLARLTDRPPQQLAGFADLHVVHPRALELRVRADEDRGKTVVQVARKAAPMFFFLGEELPGEMLEVAEELHPLDREGRLVAEDAQKGDGVVTGVSLPVDAHHALRLGGDEERDADREG